MAIEKEQLDLIAAIYDSVLEPRRWTEMLDRLATQMGARAAAAVAFDDRHPEVEIGELSSIWSSDDATFVRETFSVDEAEAYRAMLLKPGQMWLADTELFSRPIDSYPAVQWIMKKHRLRHRAVARLNTDGGWFDSITIQYGMERGGITNEERANGALYLPHLGRLFEVDRVFRILRSRFRAVLAVLDHFHIGVFVLSEQGNVIVRNAEADRILDESGSLSLTPDQRLRAADPHESARLSHAIEQATDTARSEGRSSGASITLGRPHADPLIVETRPLRGSDMEIGRNIRGAILFVYDPDSHEFVSLKGLRELYTLTSAESAVLSLIIDGYQAREIADIRSTTLPTVQSQIRNVYSKTDTRHRAELVRLALRVNLPIDPAPEPDC